MKKTIGIPLSRAVVFACLLMAFSAGAVTFAQLRFDLVDRAKAKIVRLLHTHETSVASLPDALAEPGVALNILAVQSPLPTEADLAQAPTDDRAYLQSILDAIFPDGMAGLSEEKISIEILRYVNTKMQLGRNSGNATKLLTDGYAQCGGFSVSFNALVRLAGIPAHLVNLYGLLNQGGHTLVEVYYGDQWHLYDPTFGLFFYSEPEYNQTGRFASLAELLDSSTNGWYLFRVDEQPWTGQYDPGLRNLPVVRAGEDYLADYYGYSFVDVYSQYFATTFPVAFAIHQILSFPVVADFVADETFSIGTIDKDYLDVAHATAVIETVHKAGSYYIGGGAPVQVHTWFITAPGPGLVRITYYSTQAEPPVLMLFPLKDVYVVDAVQEGSKAEFLLRITGPEAALQFWASDGMYWVDAIEAQWLGKNIDSIETP